ncbi:hypothetical protein [Spirobacillus cienkowskii]|uniref:hypothetical protein n=1 Tax=Spirobacillus cienkowskii TaxID=495820 RepID=UPI0030D1CBDE
MLKILIKAKIFIYPVLFFCLLFMIYQFNFFATVSNNFFDKFQKDSEALVVGGIVADQLGLEKQGWNLGFVVKNGNFSSSQNLFDSYEIFAENKSYPQAVFVPYKSQIGGQGWFYSFLNKYFNTNSVEILQFLPSALLALLVVLFHYLHTKVYGQMYAMVFSFTFTFSPWVSAFARNLYWSPFLWFLPCFFATLACITKSSYLRNFYFLLLFISFFAKCLGGYEFITSITLFACSPFVIGPFFNGIAKPNIKSAAIVFILCILGFISAFLIHANMRGQTISDGIVSIYQDDIKRRTYSDPSNFDPILKDSLTVSPIIVVKTYIFNWGRNFITGVNGVFFQIILILVVIGLFISKKHSHKTFVRDFVLISFMSLIPLSWYIMAKAHSQVHTSTNYVLWYFGFIPALFFVGINFLVILFQKAKKRYSHLNSEKF